MKKPIHPRTAAAGIGGALATVVLMVLGLAGLILTPVEAGAVTTLLSYGASWLPDA